MQSVYSTLLFSAAIPAGTTQTLYTTPAGMVMVLRDIDVFANAGPVAMSLQDSGHCIFWTVELPTAGAVAAWRGRQVFPAGYILKAIVGETGLMAVRASGYLLTV